MKDRDIMNNKYIIGLISKNNRTAGGKAQKDISDILSGAGYKQVNYLVRGRRISKMIQEIRFKKKLKKLPKNCTIVLQYPTPMNMTKLLPFFKVREDIRIILVMHDVGFLRHMGYVGDKEKILKEEMYAEAFLFERASTIIVHNSSMKKAVINYGAKAGKIIELEIFDYISKGAITEKHYNKSDIIIAGNLHKDKSRYLYMLGDMKNKIHFNLYGINYTGAVNEFIDYKGSFTPEELPNVLCGGFGLVWDGDGIDSCTGRVGEYLRYNNPHKMSLYIAAQIPVIVWQESATADFVREHGIGITVNSLEEIADRINKISDDEYRNMIENTKNISAKLTSGHYTLAAVKKAEGLI